MDGGSADIVSLQLLIIALQEKPRMSRIMQCECGFYSSFGHSSFFPHISLESQDPEDLKKRCEEGELDPFYTFHTACPNCGERFRPWAQEELFLPWEEFTKKIMVSADIALFTVVTKQREGLKEDGSTREDEKEC